MNLKAAIKKLEKEISPIQGEPDILLINLFGHFGNDPEAEKTGRGVLLYRNGQLIEEEGVQAGLPVIVVFIGADATKESVIQAIETAKGNEQLNKTGYVCVTVGMDDD